MTPRAAFVGELALRVLSRGGEAVSTRVFSRSVYLRSRDDFLLLYWGGLKSPFTINLNEGKDGHAYSAGQRFRLSKSGLDSDGVVISVKGALVYKGLLRRRQAFALPSSADLARGVVMLRSLYDVASGPVLANDPAFSRFVDTTLTPFATDKGGRILAWESYAGLIGRGGGFTPAGDDFVAGFAATFNFMARCEGNRRIELPIRQLVSATVPESGAIVAYSSRGYVDEGMESLILISLGPRQSGFHRELLTVASRGHTSGVDMALGVLLCEATAAEKERRDGILQKCIAAL